MKMNNTFINLMTVVIALPALFACEQQEINANIETPLPEVAVATVISEKISERDEFTGRLQAAETVIVMPRVSGYIQQVLFAEGKLVEQGEVLIELDAAPFQAEVTRLRAELRIAQTEARLTQGNLQRAEQLSGLQAISTELLDNRRAAREQAGAQVRSASAALQKAQLELSYTRITAPISGRMSYAQITAGNFVTAGQSELTQLVSLDKMHVYFDVDEHSYLRYSQRKGANQWANNAKGQSHPVYMSLTNNANDEHHVGFIDFVDNRIDTTTGTIRLRATFNNSEQNLIPGLYTHITLPSSEAYQGILIDDKAIGTDLNNKYVLVANDDVLEYRAVSLGERVGGLRVVKRGLQADEQIVVNGLQRVRASMRIAPKLVDMASSDNLSLLRLEQQSLEQALDEALELPAETLAAHISNQLNQG